MVLIRQHKSYSFAKNRMSCLTLLELSLVCVDDNSRLSQSSDIIVIINKKDILEHYFIMYRYIWHTEDFACAVSVRWFLSTFTEYDVWCLGRDSGSGGTRVSNPGSPRKSSWGGGTSICHRGWRQDDMVQISYGKSWNKRPCRVWCWFERWYKAADSMLGNLWDRYSRR